MAIIETSLNIAVKNTFFLLFDFSEISKSIVHKIVPIFGR
jgi:hypothetical protein